MAVFNSKNKLFLILGLFFIVTVAVIIFIVQYQTNGIIGALTLNRIKTANRTFSYYLADLGERASLRAEVISRDESVINAVKNRDCNELKKDFNQFTAGIDFITICDSGGIVLARSHNDITGDDISGYTGISQTLRTRTASTSLERVNHKEDIFSIYSNVPVFSNGEFTGIVSCSIDLTRNVYVDLFKERTGCEASIFLDDIRISTTLTDETGSRVTGTKTFDFIVDTVIKQQKEYAGNLVLYGRMYGVCYTPLISEGQTIGMLFTGADIVNILNSRRAMNFWIIRSSIIALIFSIAFILIFGRALDKYAFLSNKQQNQQMLMADISRIFLTDANTNTLITDTLRIVGEFMEVSQLLLFWLDDDGTTLICRNEWINPSYNFNTRIGSRMILIDPMLSIIKNLKPGSGNDSCLSSNDAVIRKAMAPYRVNFQNYITTPVYIKGEMVGAVDFSKEGLSHTWSYSEISLATHYASTLSGVFEREAMGRRTSIVENSPIMIFYSDAEGNLAYANPAATTVTGYSLSELHEGGFELIMGEEELEKIKDIYIPHTIVNGMIKHETSIMCKNGQVRILEVTNFVLKDEITAAICIDLTETRELEAEILMAKEKAEQANRAKSEFLSNMSHEMRTPMNAIIGMTEIALKSQEIDKKDYSLSKVVDASKHLLGIINDVLDMSKIEAGKFELTITELELRSLVQKTVSFVRLNMEAKKQRFSMHVDDNVPFFFLGDDQRLMQVIMNLLANAVKFTPEEGVISLNVSLISIDDDICLIRFEVEDSGIGMSLEQQSRIFKIFEQAESGTRRKFGGTGLGLSISKYIVELMNGEIIVESEPGIGSKFIFNIKMKKIDKDPSFIVHYNDSLENIKNWKNEFAGKKVLLAEDIEINREILISLLDGAGLDIDCAVNGREALDKYTSNPGLYNLILMDMRMPEMDGIDATRYIREFEKDNSMHVPIIAMTANVFKEDIDACKEAGMDDHVGKPLEINIIIEKLRKYL